MTISDEQAGQIYENATKALREEYGSVSEAPDLEDYNDMDITEQAEVDDRITASIEARDYAHGLIRARKEVQEFREEYGTSGEELTDSQLSRAKSLISMVNVEEDGLETAVAKSLNA